MKAILIITGSLALAVGIGLFATRDTSGPRAAGVEIPIGQPEGINPGEGREAPVRPVENRPASEDQPASETPVAPPEEPAKTSPGAVVLGQAIQTLLAPNASFQQKQAVWGQLRSAGKLDPVIAELEQRTAANPGVAENSAVLGQAYLQKAGTIQDIREQGILGMKADQSFEAALNADPQNWDARFWKATAMSYWPPQLGKGQEVIESCLQLLNQQELQPPKPEFAQVYLLLGNMYEREGNTDSAQQVWKRGLGLFPGHEALASKSSGTR